MTDTTVDQVDAIARAAKDAFALVSKTDDTTRAAWLRGVADAIDADAAGLIELAAAETALPASPRLGGELARTTAQLRLFAKVIEEGSYLEATIDHPDATATPPIPDLRRVLRPIGPVAVFAASNFPFAFSVAGGDTASALAVGCPVVVKAHPGHPETSRRMAAVVAEALAAAGAPEGTFALIEGFEAGLALVDHPAIRAVGFTGSVRGGRALLDRAAARPEPIPFYGELGSLNPVVITPGADAARGGALAEGLAGSFQLGAGQFCTKPGVVLVPEGSAVESALPGLLAPQSRLLTEAISAGFSSGVDRVSGVPGVEVVAGDAAPDGTAPLVAATTAANLLEHADELLEEVFGPFTLLVRYRDEAERDAVIAALPGNLTATVHHEESEDVEGLVGTLEGLAGRVLFAGWPTGVAVSWAQHHGGPWPSTNANFTSVGATAVRRFQRPVAYQDAPASLLPAALREDNPLGIPRRVDGVLVLP
ncbi:aldehyde dehydrogenase (NADP(+)) [Microbacterium stercoris]|uniref:Aldehyde dehydrogenase (NADP(+)) n=1 Tax=Microbacterium stercoris TaxID=2820289 RepID=A0A939QNR5_9MICO|nr:aldehyde dehydrogenase (NADP(+)) [Microbacterium stercoris]MBO3662093.1 aldehyde dehydrogenase (NADP(+)) [Microbacterium stercoris]